MLIAAGLDVEEARELADTTRLTAVRAAELRREGVNFDSRELRPALSALADAAARAEADLQESIEEGPAPDESRRGRLKRALGVARRVVKGGGGVAQIVVDAAAAKVTLGATLLSISSGADDVLDAAKGD